jgi:PAS domain S-box-containing protein
MNRRPNSEDEQDTATWGPPTPEGFPAENTLRRDEIVLDGQKRALERAVNGGSLHEVLDVLTLCAERQSKDTIIASILLVNQAGDLLLHGSAPNLPLEYINAITGRRFGPKAGSCGTAFTKTEVLVSDIANDPRWKDYKHLALSHGLAACWSTPVLSSSGELLATFAVYYKKPQHPSQKDRAVVELLARTAGIVIEWFSEVEQRKDAEAALKKSDQHLRALMTATTDVIYMMSADWKKMWTLYGQNFLSDTTDAIDDWQEKYLLPEDRKPVEAAINRAIENKSVFQLEHRVIQANGTIGWTLSRAIPILDDAGNILEWYGVATDVTERKRHETSLADTLSLLESILKNAPIGYALFNDKHEYLQVNDALASINGFNPESHIGKNVADISPFNSKYLTEILDTVFKSGKSIENIEIKRGSTDKSGIEQLWLATFYPVVVEGSVEVKYVVAAILEITDRVKTEQALRESEQQFRDFSNSIQNLAWMAHGDGRIYWYNQRWFDYTGTTLEQMQGLGWTKVHHPDYVASKTEFIREAGKKGEQWERTVLLRGRNGEYRWFLTRAYPIKDDRGKVTRWIGTCTDIHEKLQIQDELKESRNQLRQIADFMPQMVWSTDASGYNDFLNKRWDEFTGLTFDEMKGHRWMQVLHPDDLQRTSEAWHRSLRSGETYEIEYRMKRYDGEYRWMLARGMPLRRTDGTIERWYGTCTDIHDQKTMAENLETLVQERTKELQRSNEDLQQFVHVSSHDLKEPVRKIQFFENIISNQFQGVLPDDVNANLQKIRKSARRIAAMLEGVLHYSSVDASMTIIEDIDLNAVVNDVAEDQEVLIMEKNAKLKYYDLPVIRGAPTLIYQLFYNLINDSLKFAGEKPALITITSKQSKIGDRSFWKIVLEDNGIGFDDVYSELIFVTFTRLNAKDKYEGTGLGLALCKKIVERHGGSITATGKKNSGAKFTILLPVER